MNERWIQRFQTVESNPIPRIDPTVTIATGIAAILLPTLLVFSIVAQRTYRQHRIKRRIDQLERSWQLRSHQNTR